MLHRMAWPWKLVLTAGSAALLSMVCAATGQAADVLPGLDQSQADLFSLAQQPVGETKVEEPSFDLAAYSLEEAEEKAAPKPPPVDRSTLLASRTSRRRLAGLPNMFGDSYGAGAQILGSGAPGGPSPLWQPYRYGNKMYYYLADLPPLGGARQVKVAENNKAMPMDRAYFVYNHFHNAIQSIVPPAGPYSVDRYTIGLEKTFCRGLCSAEVRMPFVSQFSYEEPGLRISNGRIGNLGVILKCLLHATDTSAVAAGVSVGTPTGSDLVADAGATNVVLSNDAVHVSPFIGFLSRQSPQLWQPLRSSGDDALFWHGFLQMDIAANSNRVELTGVDVGKYTEQNLLLVDLAVGRWLYRNRSANRFRGLAAVLEYHLTTTVQDADVVGTTIQGNWIELRNIHNRMDVSNITLGLHAEIGKTRIRVGGVLPVTEEGNRLFDSEIQVSVNRMF